MRFLLVNTNSAVRKIFNITAKKAGIQLDVVNAISQIPLNEDYNCIFVDDGVLESGNIADFKNKMITTKFCIILSKDSPLVSGFDSYIRKPFLPTDIYEVLRKEKQSDMGAETMSADIVSDSAMDSSASDDFSISSDIGEFANDLNNDANLAPDSTMDAPLDLDIDAHLNEVESPNSDIDLNEFSDSEDEFLSGVQENIPEFEPQDTQELAQEPQITQESQITQEPQVAQESPKPKIRLKTQTAPQAQDSAQDSASIQTPQNPLKTAPQTPPPTQDEIFEQAETQINTIKALSDSDGNFYNSKNDSNDIDFSAVLALQDEILKEEQSKKGRIGGDIYKKKEPPKPQITPQTPQTPQTPPQDSNDSSDSSDLDDLGDSSENAIPAQDSGNSSDSSDSQVTESLHDFEDENFDALQDLSNETSEILPSQESEVSAEIADDNAPSKYNMLGLPIDESGDVRDINDLSEEELESLDDEALLLLQEKSLQEKSLTAKKAQTAPIAPEPKVLNKQDINDITNILEDTQNTPNIAINNNEFASLTQEALGEALGEEVPKSAEALDDDLIDLDSSADLVANENLNANINTDLDANLNTIAPKVAPKPAQVMPSANPPLQGSLDIVELVKVMPIDKLRDLFSGVQITINITFPTKK